MKPEICETCGTFGGAPDLIEACKNALRRLHHAKQYGPDMQSSQDLCIQDAKDILISAIAKAEGN